MIYETLSDRLLRVWEYYLRLQSKAEEGLATPLSSAPCTPAPGRRIIIIRCDNQLPSADIFVSFDRVLPHISRDQVMAHRRSSSEDSTGSDDPPSKKRWGLLRAIFGNTSTNRPTDSLGGSSSDESDNGGTELTMAPDSKCLDGHEQSSTSSIDEPARPKAPPHQPYLFKFSLEWIDRPQWPTKNKRLFTPCLPLASQLHVQHRRAPPKDTELHDTLSETTTNSETPIDDKQDDESTDGNDISEPPPKLAPENTLRPPTTKHSLLPELPSQPVYDDLVTSKYAGRALAEWAHIVSECDSFFARRRDEGVPSDRAVETPTLGVESFRK